jgi:uncharacterized protein (DUF1778 family)
MSKRSELLQVRLTKGEVANIKRAAKSEGLSVSDHVRVSVLLKSDDGVTRGERGSSVPKTVRRA